MRGPAPFAVFCHDIRDEKGNTSTLVGVCPDNVDVDGFPGVMGTLAIYVRWPVEPDGTDMPPPVFLMLPEGPPTPFKNIDPEVVASVRAKAKDNGAPISFILGRLMFTSFAVPHAGRLTVVARWPDGDQVIASLNIRQSQTEASPRLLPEPSSAPVAPTTASSEPAKRPRKQGRLRKKTTAR